MNKKSKTIKKSVKNQNDSIANYFGKTLKAIYLERLQEEIQEQPTVNDFEIESTRGDKIGEGLKEKQNDIIENDDFFTLKERNCFLEEKFKELIKQNAILSKDNRV